MNDDTAAGGRPAEGGDGTPGSVLLAERRRQNLSLGDVSRQLKLSVRQVEALERDDFSGFQGPVFVHGFLRNYAKLLALDPNPLIRAADRLLNPAPVQPVPEPVAAPGRKTPESGKSKWPLAAGIVVVVVVAGIVAMNNRGEPEARQAAVSAAEDHPAAATEKRQPVARTADKSAEKAAAEKLAAEKSIAEKSMTEKPAAEKTPAEKRTGEKDAAENHAEPAPAAMESLAGPIASAEAVETGPRMIIRMIFDQDSWVEIKDRNGNTVFGQLNPAGSRRSASGEPPLSIVVGNAAGVRLFKGEKSIDLAPHTRVDVARLTVE